MAVKSILVVCRGNICRSPMAEGFLINKLANNNPSMIITSAGITALVDHPADDNAITVMKKYGMDISNHRARQLTENLVRKSDLILVMSQSQSKILIQNFFTAKGKTFLIGHWQGFEINDPYKQSYDAFETVYQQLELAWPEWNKRILS